MSAPNLPPGSDLLPRRMGKYTLVRRLATGGMAELFLAIQRSVAGFEKLIVIKRILPSLNQDQAYVEMLLHEARVAATLSHPNVVQVFDLGSIDGGYFIAMEHVHGEDLRSLVRQMKAKHLNEFPMEHALSIVLGVCSGLTYAHEKEDLYGAPLNIVHRDVSPQNVLVTFSGGVKLIDFGIAKSRAHAFEETEHGRLKGKIPYMSPEQARGEAVDWRSDIFAAGVILFELTTGRRLFKAASEFETLKLICDGPYPLPSEARPDYPRDLEAIVVRALARNREDRWQSAREMQAALEDLVRCERIPASTIALSRFMHSLFADKLLSEDEALHEHKRLADTILSDLDDDGPDPYVTRADVSSQIVSFGPTAASRTIPDGLAPGRTLSGALVGALGLLAVVTTAVGTALWMDRATARSSSVRSAPPACEPVLPARSDASTP
jgi:serine/threonine protein kinase